MVNSTRISSIWNNNPYFYWFCLVFSIQRDVCRCHYLHCIRDISIYTCTLYWCFRFDNIVSLILLYNLLFTVNVLIHTRFIVAFFPIDLYTILFGPVHLIIVSIIKSVLRMLSSHSFPGIKPVLSLHLVTFLYICHSDNII